VYSNEALLAGLVDVNDIDMTAALLGVAWRQMRIKRSFQLKRRGSERHSSSLLHGHEVNDIVRTSLGMKLLEGLGVITAGTSKLSEGASEGNPDGALLGSSSTVNSTTKLMCRGMLTRPICTIEPVPKQVTTRSGFDKN